MQPQPTLIAGHRGAKGLAPENTIGAFEKAIELGADMVEFDVRRTADGTLVVHHDEDIAGSLLRDLSCKRLLELKEVRVPTLEEVLRLCTGRIAVDIELKETGCEEAVLKLVSEHANTDEVIVTSFIDSVVARVKEIDSSIRTGLLIGPKLPNPLYANLFGPFPFRRCAKGRSGCRCAALQPLAIRLPGKSPQARLSGLCMDGQRRGEDGTTHQGGH